ncbi:alpha/beta fold hydrolase [Streptomyces botrytidirepellens]|uniref:Alpha/beta hydrolase n=1 Tax=Streptomyces botrytidirepellens TaxID=2486417 RepID=A0A3M8WCC5_9ACTN|nr:alpha/beta hydrolase [Streptomyces botrytidirepellens]RNG27758.1 alpha/beta hydrolase [Streptomyces botrytidirepellens]
MPVVLIHGATCSAATWNRLVPLLEGEVLAVDLPGRGARADIDLHEVTLNGCAKAVAQDITHSGFTDITLVAHSFGGVVTPQVMSLVPDRIRQVVLLSAVVPPDGTTVADHIDVEVKEALASSMAGGIYTFGPEAARALLCSDADEEQAAEVQEHLVDDAAALLAEPVDLTGYRLPVPRTYIRLSQDRCYSPELQSASAQRINARMISLSVGHMPMVTKPYQVAEILNALAAPRALG